MLFFQLIHRRYKQASTVGEPLNHPNTLIGVGGDGSP
jgi:hypothetical protein